MSLEKIKILGRQLFPTGRAFKMPFSGEFEKMMSALAASEARAVADAKAIRSSLLPDNDDFTAADATDWERRLGLITNSDVLLADRKLAISRKMNHPGDIPARQSYRFLERELRAAGFDVWVYENRFPYGDGTYYTKNPSDLGIFGSQYGQFRYGQRQYGGAFSDKVVNYIDESLDLPFSIGSNFRCTFFVGGFAYGDYNGEIGYVDSDRKDEFRQLILKIKPVQTVGLLFITYI